MRAEHQLQLLENELELIGFARTKAIFWNPPPKSIPMEQRQKYGTMAWKGYLKDFEKYLEKHSENC